MTRRDIILATEAVEDTEIEETEETEEQEVSVIVEQIDYTEFFTNLTENVEQMRTFTETTVVEQYEKTITFYDYVTTALMTVIIAQGILIGLIAWWIVGKVMAK